MLPLPRPCASLWKSSGNGKKRRPGGQRLPLQRRLGSPRLGLKVKEVESNVLGLRVLHGEGRSGQCVCVCKEYACSRAGLKWGLLRWVGMGCGTRSTGSLLLALDSDDALLKMTISQQEFSCSGSWTRAT